ncbi:Exocyst complex component SEC5 [Rhodotorula toruloides]|uniref:Exocyst complex component SEC5 n=1 Tax=Rhodotorula toruloides TaxID=5286 RepID=A0A2T0A3G4_RHOTO|nr:Exocyst complex component SEC5 [Rhodotorula toruloides]PRQ72552.1 Exocyst complex component Sec5-domain containing protein [Rhodotorula toruloides]
MQSRSYTRPVQQEPQDFDPRQPLPPHSTQRPSHDSERYRRPSSSASERDPRAEMRRQGSGHSGLSVQTGMSGRDGAPPSPKPQDWEANEEAMLELYGLSTLAPTHWEAGETADSASVDSPKDGFTGATGTAKVAGAPKGDESDPLGLMRGGILANNPDLPSDLRSAVLPHSKSFDPKVFLSTVHPNATFKDLNVGRERLKESLEKRSGALKLLVEAEWDRFVAVKAATETVFEEMKDGGPLTPGEDYGVKSMRDTLKAASSRAETVFQPIVEARTKAERLKSTLGVFERSKFFFNLPTILGEAVEEGRYEVALQAYKKGRYILASRPAQLLGLPVPTTPQQQQQQKRIYDKVWGQVEKIIGDLRATLGKRLRDTKRGLDEVEKTIEILLELDPSDDPVWIFFDTQHRHILQLLRSSADSSMSRIRIAMDQFGEAEENDRKQAADLGTGVASLQSLDGERVRENAAGAEVWRLIFDFVRNLNEVIMQTLPSFWKVAKGYMEGKYQKKNTSSSAASRRSPTQCRVMTQDIVTLYVSLLSQFFTLSSSTSPPVATKTGADDLNATPPMPSFVPPIANATTNCHWLLRVLNELMECVSEMSALELSGEATQSLKELVASTRWRFEEAICSGWVRDAKVFYRLETWRPDPDDPAITAFLRQVTSFQRFMAISAYRVAGGSEERGNALMGSSSSSSSSNTASRNRQDVTIPTDFQRKIQSAFLDGLYAFLDGLVHVAFSDPETIYSSPSGTKRRGLGIEADDDTGRPKEVDIRNVDIRILLTVSNLTHLRETTIPRLINQFQSAYKVDMASDIQMLMDVTEQLDKILFDDYVKRKSAEIAKIIRKGVLGGTVNWYEADKPTEVHPFIYDALLSLVLVHAQVSATARPLVSRTLGSLVEELANVALEAFSKVERFGMGGMLQATLEIEFMHQTLSQHVSPLADQTLQSIYKTISQSYYRRPNSSAQELQQELEGLKRTLVASRRATALQFLCFRRPSKQPAAPPQTTSGKVIDGGAAAQEPKTRRGAVVGA